MRKTCVKCKYSAWCLPREFCTYDADKCRPLFCTNCDKQRGVADLVLRSDIIEGIQVSASLQQKPDIQIQPCKRTDENVVYINVCPYCVRELKDEESRVAFTITMGEGIYTCPIDNPQIISVWKQGEWK